MWFFKKKQIKGDRNLVGDLDKLTRKSHYVRYLDKEWLMPELTARQYAEICALLEELEELSSSKKHPDRVEEIYDEVFSIAVPELPSRVKKKMPLVDAHALFLTILKRYGFTEEKKKTDQPK